MFNLDEKTPNTTKHAIDTTVEELNYLDRGEETLDLATVVAKNLILDMLIERYNNETESNIELFKFGTHYSVQVKL